MSDNKNTSKTSIQVIIGLGKTGLSCARHLHHQKIPFAITDSRENPPGLSEFKQHFPDVPLSVGQLAPSFCLKASRLIVSPGVSLKTPVIQEAIARGIPVIADIELFAEHAKAPIIAITGSNGKSTVTTLVGEMAKKAGLNVGVGGNLGTPALDLLSDTKSDLYVLELSSFQLESSFSLKPFAAVLLNLSEDHQDRYDTLSDYRLAKQRIYQHCQYAVANRQEAWLCQNAAFTFGTDAPMHANEFGLREIDNQHYLCQGQTPLIQTAALSIKGKHQLANALAALALGHAFGLPLSAMLGAIQDFKGLAHRCQWIGTKNGVTWYNDSKATNVGAAQAALTGLGDAITGKLIVIAGGQGKKSDFTPLQAPLKKYARCLILIGEDAALIEEALTGSTDIQQAKTLPDAVALAEKNAQSGDVVILAPACASFDMFDHFEHRGEVFMAAVKDKIALS